MGNIYQGTSTFGSPVGTEDGGMRSEVAGAAYILRL